MQLDNLELIAPAFSEKPWNEAQALGAAVWLWMHSASHRDVPLHTLNALLLPAIANRQFIIGYESGRPVFYAAWCWFSVEAEQRYVQNPAISLPAHDWNSGERLWFLDWVTPFGHSARLARLVQRHLFADSRFSALYHRGNERGLRIKRFQGAALARLKWPIAAVARQS
ncbi:MULTISPECIES: toxin-activating lysine-acyltransferase [Pseudomonas]|jgi:cytolysin-activating lysine-acyltransferase|uniref:toxin-activating lysine-acyltransferase n=1 Tax=Pseudomonas TaxID=286 RepID=UPI00099C4241|nr:MULTISPECIES: toxin-activating lysine-acyltransferase [Pseudomonas]OPB07461.1 toxin-activating lysine-acyltransferase [Pseudomonas fluorescens]TVT87719.1 toxin-activating lysine-acyltransferase [Pseudomonas sp. RGB]UEL24366.1 toxin-activating lysine-acyltransferase [Pseudomonas fluorescens]